MRSSSRPPADRPAPSVSTRPAAVPTPRQSPLHPRRHALKWTRSRASGSYHLPGCLSCLGANVSSIQAALRGRRVGVVCNPASIDAAFRHMLDRVASEPGVTLAAIFGPQHGFRSDVQDNMIETAARATTRRGACPSTRCTARRASRRRRCSQGLDALVIDLQDVGVRIYTYIYTMANCLRACGRHGVPVIVCDRPNPIGGAGRRRADAASAATSRSSACSRSRCATG